MEVVVEQFERLEQIIDGTILSEKRVTGRIERQRDNEVPQGNVQPVVLVCPFLEVLIGKGNILVDNWLHVFWGEELVVHWEQGLLH